MAKNAGNPPLANTLAQPLAPRFFSEKPANSFCSYLCLVKYDAIRKKDSNAKNHVTPPKNNVMNPMGTAAMTPEASIALILYATTVRAIITESHPTDWSNGSTRLFLFPHIHSLQ